MPLGREKSVTEQGVAGRDVQRNEHRTVLAADDAVFELAPDEALQVLGTNLRQVELLVLLVAVGSLPTILAVVAQAVLAHEVEDGNSLIVIGHNLYLAQTFNLLL